VIAEIMAWRGITAMRRGYFLGALFLATVLLAGCSIAPSKNSAVPNPASTLTATPSSVDLGAVADGSTTTASVVVTNTSTTSGATVTQATVTGTGFGLGAMPTLPVVIQAGKSMTLAVTFSPTKGGNASGSLSVVSDAADANLDVALTGNGLAAGQLAVSPSTMLFGSIAVGSSLPKSGTLTAGSSSITVSTIDQTATDYALSGITFPATIAAGQSVNFTVTFAPQTAGSFPGTIAFVSDATNLPSLSLTGTGTQAVSHSVTLNWNDSQPVTGYNVYRGTTSGGPYSTKLTSSLLSTPDYVDTTVQSGATYYYVATAVDASGESGFSNQAAAVIP
jgi:hypothetical protein